MKVAADAHDVSRPPLRVLIDAQSSDLREGTGISTYSRVLGECLQTLGFSTAWLFGRETKLGDDPVANEVAFADPPVSSIGLLRHLQAAERLALGLIQGRVNAVRAPQARVVQSVGEGPATPAFNVPGLYRRARFRHELLGRLLDVDLPEPFDVFHLTAPLPVRVRNVRTVTTIHDLIPLRFPRLTVEHKGRMVQLLRRSVANSDLIITVSEASKADIVEVLNCQPEKIAVTYQTTDLAPLDTTEREELPRSLERLGLEVQKYILFVGAIEPKKNLRRAIEAFLEIDADHVFVIVGRRAWLWEGEIGDLERLYGETARRRLRFLGYAPPQDLRRLYAGASLLLFPSLAEGFGLPALEAMISRCPVLTSDTPALREICGEAALFANPRDVGDIRRALERMLSDAELRQRLIDIGTAQAAKFSRVRYVERLREAYSRLS